MDAKLEEIFGDDMEGGSVLEVYDEMVTTMAGSIYSELDRLVAAYGPDAVTGLMPLMVSVLESLASTCACARDREDQLEMVQEDKQRLLIQYERERDGRKRAEERCMEMEDSIDQERKLFKANLLTMEAQTKSMEMKARSYADQIVGLEEQKALLNKELVSLTQVHAKIVKSYKELRYQRSLSLEAARLSGRTTPQGVEKKMTLLDFTETPSPLDAPSSLESVPDAGCPDTLINEKTKECKPDSVKDESQTCTNELSNKAPESNVLPLGDELHQDGDVEKEPPQPEVTSVIDDIINSTPELTLNSEQFESSSPKTPKEHSEPEEEELDRNNDSLFAEVCGTSPEFIAYVDEGADLQGIGDSVDALIVENAQLRDAQSEVDMARKSLIARVEELTAEREALRRDMENVSQNFTRCESKLKETEQELQMTRVELDEARKLCRENAEVDIPAAQRKRFTRTEMARVLMERNQYKEKLMELQDAVRRTEMLRASKDVQAVQMKKSSIWKVFDRLFSSSSGPQSRPEVSPPAPAPSLNRTRSASSVMYSDGGSGARNHAVSFHVPNTPHTDDAEAVPLRGKKHEQYRQIRSHIWKEHGRAQLHGWSIPPALRNRGAMPEGSDVTGVPVLVQLRLLDQKDPCTKLWCATGTSTPDPVRKPKENAAHAPSLVWICSGTHSVSEIMVIDASSSNHVMDQFVIPNTHVLCVTSVPAHQIDGLEEEESGEGDERGNAHRGATVWLGTQEGSLFIHSAESDWKKCLQKVQLKDAIHSIIHAGDRVVAALGDGTLAVFSRSAARSWDLDNPKVVELGRPQQSIRCAVYVHGEVWCGYRNRIYVLDPRTAKIKKYFEATHRAESQVRHIAAAGDGVWVSVRLDSVLRLFHARTGQPLQELELEPIIQRMLGSSLGMPMTHVSALSVFCGFLWVGTTCGVIVAIPLSTDLQSGQISENEKSQKHNVPQRGPYCSLENAQVSFHGHRDAVKFFACVPGCINPSLPAGGSESTGNTSMLLMSGGEGYINFRIGDETGDTDEGCRDLLLTMPRYRRSERSHLIVWQIHT